jgi:hypothetical protein
VCLLVTLG